jgi:HEAT repeat protein
MLPAINLRTQSYAAQAPPTVEAELRKKRIPLTQAALEEALSDSRPDVRGLAAAELASMKETVSVPLIVKALEEETDQQARFNLASALLELGSQTGNKALSQICVSTSLTNDRRLLAASRLINVGDFSCLASIESILRETTNPSEKSSALLLLTQVKPLPASLTPRIHNTLVASLKDPNSAVRHYAGQCIAALGDRHAETDLKAAIATEKDDQTRERLMQSLAGLEGKP